MLSNLRKSEPVRLYVWPALVIVAGAAVAYGLIGGDEADMILGLIALVLGVPAAEVARRKVTPVDGGVDASIRRE